MAFTTYLDDLLVNCIFGAVAITPPATIYVGLSSTLPTVAGANITEPTIGTNSYTRAATTNNTTNWPTTATNNKATEPPSHFPPRQGHG